jgi:hypothetical protein
VDLVFAKASGKNGGGGGCLLISTVLFKNLSLDKCQGFKYSTPKEGAQAARENIHGGMRPMRVMTTGANELMEWVENICRFAISVILKQYKGCGRVLRARSVPGRRA